MPKGFPRLNVFEILCFGWVWVRKTGILLFLETKYDPKIPSDQHSHETGPDDPLGKTHDALRFDWSQLQMFLKATKEAMLPYCIFPPRQQPYLGRKRVCLPRGRKNCVRVLFPQNIKIVSFGARMEPYSECLGQCGLQSGRNWLELASTYL